MMVFVALGSNLGDSAALVREAIERLRPHSLEPLRQSSLWQTMPVDCPPGSPVFVNAVVGLVPRPEQTPAGLLAVLQGLEREFGRPLNRPHHAPRPLDLDLIAFGQVECASASLVLPHPRAHTRRFVLAPLAEIAPELVLPGQTLSVAELLRRLPGGESVVRTPIGP